MKEYYAALRNQAMNALSSHLPNCPMATDSISKGGDSVKDRSDVMVSRTLVNSIKRKERNGSDEFQRLNQQVAILSNEIESLKHEKPEKTKNRVIHLKGSSLNNNEPAISEVMKSEKKEKSFRNELFRGASASREEVDPFQEKESEEPRGAARYSEEESSQTAKTRSNMRNLLGEFQGLQNELKELANWSDDE
jgi:hypothetical protein